MIHLLPTVPYQKIGMTGNISGERLTSSSRAGVTSTVCVETLLVSNLTFQRRAWSGIDGDLFTGYRNCRKSKNLCRRGGDGPVGGAKRQWELVVSLPQKTFCCLTVSPVMAPEESKYTDIVACQAFVVGPTIEVRTRRQRSR
jgi:hypothetical protein